MGQLMSLKVKIVFPGKNTIGLHDNKLRVAKEKKRGEIRSDGSADQNIPIGSIQDAFTYGFSEPTIKKNNGIVVICQHYGRCSKAKLELFAKIVKHRTAYTGMSLKFMAINP